MPNIFTAINICNFFALAKSAGIYNVQIFPDLQYSDPKVRISIKHSLALKIYTFNRKAVIYGLAIISLLIFKCKEGESVPTVCWLV